MCLIALCLDIRRLKNKIQYGSVTQDNQPQSLAKIQHLESLVYDLEASERKLQRRVVELQEIEAELRERLTVASPQPVRKEGVVRSVIDREKHIDLLQTVRYQCSFLIAY